MDDEVSRLRADVETVRAELDRLKQAASVAGVGFWEWDLHNDTVVITQPTPDGDHVQTVTNPRSVMENSAIPEDLPRIQGQIQQAVEDVSTFQIQYRLRQVPDEWRVSYGRAFAGHDGKTERVVGVAMSLKELKDAEQTLRESEERYRLLFEYVPYGVMLASADSGIIVVNPHALKLLKRELFEVVGRPTTDLVHPEDVELVRDRIKVLSDGAPVLPLHLLRLVKGDGSNFLAEVRAMGFDIQGVRHRMLIFEDVSERLRNEEERERLHRVLEQQVEKRTRELKEANDQVQAFSYTVSHDLRGPLRSMDGFAYMLEEALEANDPEEALLCAKRVRESVKRMSTLIDDMLLLAGISRRPFNPKKFDMTRLVEDLVLEISYAQPNLVSVIRVEPGMTAYGDERLIRLAMQNLLDNAIKFSSKTPDPKIEIGQENGSFYVRDNGAGFDDQHVSQLFQPFYRLHNERDFPGSGIGLASVHRIIQRHGGHIGARGEVEKGAEFRFELPEPNGSSASD